MLPADVLKSDWNCTIEQISRQGGTERNIADCRVTIDDCEIDLDGNRQSSIINHQFSVCPRGEYAVRLGLRYVRGLREDAAQALLRERARRPFASITDLARRVPELRKPELNTLARVGALNSIGSSRSPATNNQRPLHRRDALWQVARAAQPVGPLLHNIAEPDAPSPLAQMNTEERLVADFAGTGLTIGPHAMQYQRAELRKQGVLTALELETAPNGKWVKAAGCVIARQRPGTAHGFVFLSLEDETGIANAIITPDLFKKYRIELVSVRFMLVEGVLQHQDNVISVRAQRITPLHFTAAETSSHDFH
jgi:error-prone DNA polymerase